MLWSGEKKVYEGDAPRLEWPQDAEVGMPEGFTGGGKRILDRRLWRLLLARLHPDAGGDHELFLFACDAMNELCPAPHASSRKGPNHAFSAWKGGMSTWASRNREGLGKPRTPRR